MKFFPFILFSICCIECHGDFEQWYCCRAIEFICSFFTWILHHPVFFFPIMDRVIIECSRTTRKKIFKRIYWQSWIRVMRHHLNIRHTMTINFPSHVTLVITRTTMIRLQLYIYVDEHGLILFHSLLLCDHLPLNSMSTKKEIFFSTTVDEGCRVPSAG